MTAAAGPTTHLLCSGQVLAGPHGVGLIRVTKVLILPVQLDTVLPVRSRRAAVGQGSLVGVPSLFAASCCHIAAAAAAAADPCGLDGGPFGPRLPHSRTWSHPDCPACCSRCCLPGVALMAGQRSVCGRKSKGAGA
eukprot:1159627-Pelagomonas_calceolata.AAC.1